MRKALLLAALLLLALPVAALALWLLAVESEPRVDREVVISPEAIERAMRIVDVHRYRVRPGMLAVVTVLPDDADLAANYLAHRFARGRARLGLAEGSARFQLSVPVRSMPADGYLNVDATLVQTAGLPLVRSLRVGRVPVPDALVDLMQPTLLHWLGRNVELRAGLEALRRVGFAPGGISVTYRWQGGARLDAAASVFGPQDRERLLRYQTLLAAETARGGAIKVSLPTVLVPLFRLADERSVAGEAVAENRAAVLVATLHVLGVPLQQLLPEAAGWPRPVGRTITLDGRDDFAKHFMVSATLAAYADTILADAVGLYKEIQDARSGSGFSFDDLAADHAGTRFGEKAVTNAGSARRLQGRVAAGLRDADLMPLWQDLPQGLSEPAFRQRFGGIDAPAYQRMMREIEQRVAALPVLR